MAAQAVKLKMRPAENGERRKFVLCDPQPYKQNGGKVPREGQAAPWGTVSRLAAGIPVLLMRGSPNEEVTERVT